MGNNDYIVSLDIGTSKVRVIIGEINNGNINVIGVGSAESRGMKKGAIVDIDQTVYSIREAVDQAERMVDVSIHEVIVGIAGNHIELQPSQGVVAVSSEDREIADEDVERVIQASKVVAIPPEREIIDVIPREFIVDGLGGINDPRGMIGVRLEMLGTIVTGSKTVIHNLLRCVEKAGLSIAGLYLEPLAAAEISLSRDEKNMGIVLVDVGAGVTTISTFENGYLSATTVFPIGGQHIVNDIAIGLRTETETAEQLLYKYGCAMIEEASEDQKFKVKRIGSDLEKEYTQMDLAHIIESRVAEILSIVEDEVARLGYKGEIPGGFVLTGGVMSIPGAQELAKEELRSSVRIAIPEYIGVRSPSFTTGVGLIKHAVGKRFLRRTSSVYSGVSNRKPASRKSPKEKDSGMIERMKNWFSEFI